MKTTTFFQLFLKLNDDPGDLDLNAMKPLETLGLTLPSESEFNVIRRKRERKARE